MRLKGDGIVSGLSLAGALGYIEYESECVKYSTFCAILDANSYLDIHLHRFISNKHLDTNIFGHGVGNNI